MPQCCEGHIHSWGKAAFKEKRNEMETLDQRKIFSMILCRDPFERYCICYQFSIRSPPSIFHQRDVNIRTQTANANPNMPTNMIPTATKTKTRNFLLIASCLLLKVCSR